MAIAPGSLILRAGGTALERHGTLRKRASPREDVGAVFTRASTALYWDRNGVLRSAQTDAVRPSWEDRDDDGVYETPTIPLEAALTQLIEYAIPGGANLPTLNSSGGVVGVATATAESAAAEGITVPFDAGISSGQGDKVLKLLTGASGTQTRRYRFGATSSLNGLTAGTWYSQVVLVFLKTTSAITPANVKVRFVDDIGTTNGDVMTVKGRWERITVRRKVDVGAAEAYIEIRCEDGDNFAGTNDELYVAIPTLVAGQSIPYPIANDTASTVVKAAEMLYLDYLVPPKGLVVYLKFRERGGAFTAADSGLLTLGSAARYGVRHTGASANGYRAELAASTGAELTAPGLDSLVEILLEVDQTAGTLTLSQSVDSGAVTAAAAFAITALTAFDVLRLYVNSLGAASYGMTSMDDLKIALGTGHTMAEMRAAA